MTTTQTQPGEKRPLTQKLPWNFSCLLFQKSYTQSFPAQAFRRQAGKIDPGLLFSASAQLRFFAFSLNCAGFIFTLWKRFCSVLFELCRFWTRFEQNWYVPLQPLQPCRFEMQGTGRRNGHCAFWFQSSVPLWGREEKRLRCPFVCTCICLWPFWVLFRSWLIVFSPPKNNPTKNTKICTSPCWLSNQGSTQCC